MTDTSVNVHASPTPRRICPMEWSRMSVNGASGSRPCGLVSGPSDKPHAPWPSCAIRPMYRSRAADHYSASVRNQGRDPPEWPEPPDDRHIGQCSREPYAASHLSDGVVTYERERSVGFAAVRAGVRSIGQTARAMAVARDSSDVLVTSEQPGGRGTHPRAGAPRAMIDARCARSTEPSHPGRIGS
jgi:hypothetical protein